MFNNAALAPRELLTDSVLTVDAELLGETLDGFQLMNSECPRRKCKGNSGSCCSAVKPMPKPKPKPLQRKRVAKAPPTRHQDERLNCHTHHPRHTVHHHLRDPKHCHSPNSVSWTMVDCARPRLHRPKHAFAPRSHENQTSQGLDLNLHTRIDTIAPTPHANFSMAWHGRGP